MVRQMHGVPILNPALRVQAVGFNPWAGHWLGVLITPWFMNLMLMPRLRPQWQPVPERESRHWVFPAGVFEFIGAVDPEVGDYQACSLFSPMFEFANQAGAHDTAVAALNTLFEPQPSAPPAPQATQPTPQAVPEATARPELSKRAFLMPAARRAPHAP
jgi:[NiFe] hydrogenase assembly HybE family chaperone